MCAAAVYVGLTVVLTWPLATEIGRVVPKDLGDPLFSTWALWWNARTVPFTDAWWQAPIFHPTREAMALADHRVGLGVFTTPLILAGASPLAAYDLAFLASFVFSAAAAHALARAVGASHPAAFVAGLAFGFHPFRAAHLEHVELLSAYWLPLALVGLHRWARTHHAGWLAMMAGALLLQALTSGYYYFYGVVLLAGWVVWFARAGTTRAQLAVLAAALATPIVALAPILWRYRQAHQGLGLSRSITEIEQLSADVASFAAAPEMLAWWNTAPPLHAELALFPGLTALVVIGMALWRRTAAAPGDDRWRRLRLACAALAVLAAAVGVLAVLAGPLAVAIGPLRLSASNLYKPLSIAAVLALTAVISLPRMRRAWTGHSPFAFYVLATLALWTLTLGPTARLFGERILYKAPYAWLMLLPGFDDGFRAPARFAMLAALTMAVAAALGADRLAATLPRRATLALWLAITAGVLTDGWLDRLPLPMPPPARAGVAAVPSGSLVLELPIGAFEDLAAMYRSVSHGHPLVNGYSGYEPAHYTVLRSATAAGHFGALVRVAAGREVAVVVKDTPAGQRIATALQTQIRGTTRAAAGDDIVVTIPAAPVATMLATPPVVLPLAGVAASGGDPAPAHDGDVRTAWRTSARQAGGEHLVVDLGGVRPIGAVELALGRMAFAYPRGLAVEVSSDGRSWIERWRGDTNVEAVEAALAWPSVVPMRLPVAPAAGRYIRLTQLATADQPWAVAELAVLAPDPEVTAGSRRSSR